MLAAFHVFDQYVKAGITREDANNRVFVLLTDFAKVVGKVEIECIFAGFGDTDDMGIFAKTAEGFTEFYGQCFLGFADKEPDMALAFVQCGELRRVWLDVFVIYQDVLHGFFLD